MRIAMRIAAVLALTGSAAGATETITYTYDARGRLVQVSHSGGPASGVTTTYSHDAANNRTRVQTTGASH